MGIKEARRELIEAQTALAHHSMNQGIMRKVLDGEKRLHDPGLEELYRKTEEFRIDRPFYKQLLNIQKLEAVDTIPQRIANFAWFTGFVANNFLRDAENLPEFNVEGFPFRYAIPFQKNLIDSNKVLARTIKEMERPNKDKTVQRAILQFIGYFIENVTSVDFTADPNEEMRQKLQAIDYVLGSAVWAVNVSRMPRKIVRSICRGCAHSIWDQLG